MKNDPRFPILAAALLACLRAACAADDEAELAKQLNNPVASLISPAERQTGACD